MIAYQDPGSITNHEGWTPLSSEEIYAHNDELNHDPRCFARRHSEGETLLQLRCEPPAANPPAYYAPGTLSSPSYQVSQQISGIAIDMPHCKSVRQPGTLSNDSDAKPPPPRRNPKRLAMSKTPNPVNHQEVGDVISMMHNDTLGQSLSTKQHGSVRKSAINIIRLRAHPSRPERTGSLAPAPAMLPLLGSDPATTKDTGEFPIPPVPPKNARRLNPTHKPKSNSRDRPFDVEPMNQHKTNVRRPPTGIKHWFDAYISSDDEDEDGYAGVGVPEPQELPAEEIPRPMYSLPERGSSLAINTQTRAMTKTMNRSAVPVNRPPHSPVRSGSSNSKQSSHCRGKGKTSGVSRTLAATNLAHDSVLSLSSSSSDYSSDESDNDDVSRLPPIRDSIIDSILDDRNFEVASAASVRVQRLSPYGEFNAARGKQYQPQRSMIDLRSMQSYAPTPLTQTRLEPPFEKPSDDPGNVDATLRLLNGSGSTEHSANSTSPPSSDAAHVVAVTDEEMMFLEMMRKKRAEMRQESFTEGYAVALQSEQQRLAKRAISAPQAAMKVLQKKRNEQSRNGHTLHDHEQGSDEDLSIGGGSSASDMQRQQDDICKAQADAGFRIERFLGVSSPSQPSCATSTDLKSSENFLLPATVYTPANAPPRKSTPLECQSDMEERMEIQRRVEQFIASQGAVPPLSSIRTMRRPSNQALSPTYAVEEAMPPIPPLRKSRTESSGAESHALQHQVSVIHHNHAGMQRTSPVSAFPSHSSSSQESGSARLYTACGVQQSVLHSACHVERPGTASAPVNRRVPPHRSLTRLRTAEVLGTQRSTLEDVLDGWHDLGGTGSVKSSKMSGQRVQI